jgi:hypothetical protein
VAGHGSRIIAVDGFLLVIPLPKPHAFSAAKVDRRPNLHRLHLIVPHAWSWTATNG